MDTSTINNLISFVVCAICEGDKETALFAAKGLDCPKEVKEHILNIFTSLPDNCWD